ncbi:hypothetical protein [Gordonia polyisoprenivorans]|uniref:hypothetical protein n=1 Tax=Gordonia polyisoprenivorans TaxID=84595 RepID=UPI001AD7393E|nr:hypothetical protein [Gordonia polyisoprenivorans]QTI67930.1 hypothetical protein J6U32_20680 [Gordonia polyisoprenivorans]
MTTVPGAVTANPEPDTPPHALDSGSKQPDIPLAAWVVAGAAAFAAANPRVRRAALGGRSTGPRSWSLLERGGSTRGQVGSSRLVLIHDQTSPRTYHFRMNVPPGGHTEINPDGSATVYDAAGNPVSYVKKPWAYDSLGRPQKTWYTVDENGDLVQHVEPAPNALYPILADPDESDPGSIGLADAQGRPEGSTWQTPIIDPTTGQQTGTITNTIPQGNGDQSVQQTFTDTQGNVTSNQLVVSNGQGGYQRWANNSDGSSAYRAQDAPGQNPYGASWDAGANPGTDTPRSTYGQTADMTQSSTTVNNDDGSQTQVNSVEQSNGTWQHTTTSGDGSTTLTQSGPGGQNTTVTGQLDHNGDGWFTNSQGQKVETFTDGNGNRASITTDPTTGQKTYVFTEPDYGGTYANVYDADGKQIGRIQIDRDTGKPISGWLNDGTTSTRWNSDGTKTVTNLDNNGDWATQLINDDGSGTIFYTNGSYATFDPQGHQTSFEEAPDTRNWAQKFVGGASNMAKGTWDGATSLVGLGPYGTADAWKGLGGSAKTVIMYLPNKMGDAMAGAATMGTNSYSPPDREGPLLQAITGVDFHKFSTDPWEAAGELGMAGLLAVAPAKGLGAVGKGFARVAPAVPDAVAPLAEGAANAGRRFGGVSPDDLPSSGPRGVMPDIPDNAPQVVRDNAVRTTFTTADIDAVAQHLSRPELGMGPSMGGKVAGEMYPTAPYNPATVESIRNTLNNGGTLSEGQQNFLRHELTEKELMDGGMSYDDAHELANMTHPPYMNYPREVLEQFSNYFRKHWLDAWENHG